MNSVKFSLFDSTVMTDVFHGILLLPIHLITNHSYLTISSSVVLLYFSYSLIVSLFFFILHALCFLLYVSIIVLMKFSGTLKPYGKQSFEITCTLRIP